MIDIKNFYNNNWETFCNENSIDYNQLVKSIIFLNECINKFIKQTISISKKDFLKNNELKKEVDENGKRTNN